MMRRSRWPGNAVLLILASILVSCNTGCSLVLQKTTGFSDAHSMV